MFMRTFGKIFDRLEDVMAATAACLLLTIMLATVVKVIGRALFNHGIMGIDQLSGTMMVYVAFLGAAWVLRNEGHITIDILTSNLSERDQRVMGVVSSIVGAVACLVIAYFAVIATGLSIKRGVMVAAELEIPRAINLWVIPFGCAVLGIEFIRRALRIQKGIVLTSEFVTGEA
jgi:TRAP-type C4-dicarboxylate transport system permease small subunit